MCIQQTSEPEIHREKIQRCVPVNLIGKIIGTQLETEGLETFL